MNESTAFKNEVIVLFDGYSEVKDKETSLANCTCTLVKGKNSCTIVDTRTAWDGDEITNGTQIQSNWMGRVVRVQCEMHEFNRI